MFQTMHLWVSTARSGQETLTRSPYTPVLVNQALRLTHAGQTGLSGWVYPNTCKTRITGFPGQDHRPSLRGGAASFMTYALDRRAMAPGQQDQE